MREETEKSNDTVEHEDISIHRNTAAGSAEQINTVGDQSGKTFISKPMIRINDLTHKEPSKGKASRDRRTVIDPFGIADLSIVPPAVLPNETVTISFKATNNSDVYSMYSISLKINGEVVAAEVMKLPPGVSIPLYFTAKRNLPGEYLVKVNHLTGKFTVAEDSIENLIEEAKVTKADDYESSDRFELGLSEIDAYLQQKQSLNEKSAKASGLQSGVDKAADFIEKGLDKVGDGLVFPIEKLVEVSSKLFKIVRNKK